MNTLGTIITKIQDLLGAILPILISLGVIYFIWGVIQFIKADGEEDRQKGKDRMLYGIIGFAVVLGVWGLVDILVRTFDLRQNAPELQTLETSGACTLAGSPTFKDLLCYITSIINDSLIPLIFAIATIMFIWGIIKYFVLGGDQEEKREQGKQFMIWGIIAFAVMLSIWGLVSILTNTFNIRINGLPQVRPPGSNPSAPYQGPCPSGRAVNPTTGRCD
jgi:hypothetical protein